MDVVEPMDRFGGWHVRDDPSRVQCMEKDEMIQSESRDIEPLRLPARARGRS